MEEDADRAMERPGGGWHDKGEGEGVDTGGDLHDFKLLERMGASQELTPRDLRFSGAETKGARGSDPRSFVNKGGNEPSRGDDYDGLSCGGLFCHGCPLTSG